MQTKENFWGCLCPKLPHVYIHTMAAVLLCAALTVPATLMGHTVSNTVPLLGRLPEDRARLLRELDDALARFDESDLAAYRRGIVHL